MLIKVSRILLFSASIFILFSSGCSSNDKFNQKKAPNILWLIAEDLSPDIGCYGNDLVNTPKLDQLAAKGIRFTNIYTTAAVCTPSRTALATGMYQTSIGGHHMRYPKELLPEIPAGVQTIFQLFRKNGYVTANIKSAPGTGKTDWSFKSSVEDNFNYFNWKDLSADDKPFFAQINIKNTHRPFDPENSKKIHRERITIPAYYPDHSVTREDFGNYYGDIEELDRRIGKVLDSLREYNLDKNTIIIFFSDHGRPMTRGKTWLYDSGIKIPMIIYIPEGMDLPEDYEPGAVNNRLISSIDVTATTLSLAGIEKPGSMQGKIFLGTEEEPERDFVFSAADRMGEVFFKSRSIRTNSFKYIRNYNHDFSVNSAQTAYRKAHLPVYHLLNILHEKGALNDHQAKLLQPLPYEELYDLENDPLELNNLADNNEYKKQLAGMAALMDGHLEAIDDQGLKEDSQELVKAFEAYADESGKKYEKKIDALQQQVLKEVERDKTF